MPGVGDDPNGRRDPTSTWIEVTIRLAVLGLLLYLSFTLIQPFITIAIWSIVLTVALYPVYDWMVRHLGGRRRLAAVLLTLISLLVIIGPATWLALGRVAPHLRPVGSALLQIAAEAGTGTIKFFIAIFVAGFLFSPAPSLVETMHRFSRRLVAGRGEEFVDLAGATIRTVARGVIGISALQAFFAGIGFVAAGIPGASLLTSAVLILGIIQIGPSIIIIPLIIWSWFSMETTAALLFTVYMIPVNLMDNILRPLVMGRGLTTPMLVILIGVIGGVLSYGITGLFLGPIVLAVIWELLVAWIKEREGVSTPAA
jgi:predicted PurR-regulated permease PerM